MAALDPHDALSAHYTVIAADLPGHGDSALPETPDHAGISQALATGLREILGDALPVTALGFSFGGVAFAWLAALHPGVLARVILIGCGGLDTPHGAVDLQRVSGLVGEARRARMKANLLGLMLHDPDSADALALHMLLPNARKARLMAPALVLPDMLVKALARVDIPVDAIWGEFDRPHPDPHLQAAALRAFQPTCDFRVIAGAGHWAIYERPEACNAALLDMLARPRR